MCGICRNDMQALALVEKCVVQGLPLLLVECTQLADNVIQHLIHNRNTAPVNNISEGWLTDTT